METIPFSDSYYVGESDCPDHGSKNPCKYDEKLDFFQDTGQVEKTDMEVDNVVLNGGDSLELREGEGQFILERFPTSEGCSNDGTYYEFDINGRNLSCDSPDSEEHLSEQDFDGPDNELEDSRIVLDGVDSELPSNKSEESARSEFKTLGVDEAQAVWVKWRGKWQSGIRCARADWPLMTVKAKPTHDRKQYLVIFFPQTRNYSWADVLLVRPINEFPNKIDKVGLKMVKDLTIARRFIMQKLAVSMLNVLDQLPLEALVEAARDVAVLKEFAMEASNCVEYSDLGRMLVKLQNMILETYIISHWFQHLSQSWRQRCIDAVSAESVELLKEELTDSIVWTEVNSLAVGSAAQQPGSDWKNWKNEVMKWFSISHPTSSTAGSNEPTNADISGIQISRKRPKLEVRRADAPICSSHPLEADSTFFSGTDGLNCSDMKLVTPNKESSIRDCGSDKWDDIVVEDGKVEPKPGSVITRKAPESSHNRQCVAFIEAKGRQCVRFANEGDVYCCVHLASRFSGNSAKAEAAHPIDSPMCEGTTVLGTKCKHRALIGSSFCKKHRPNDGRVVSLLNKPKRKIEETVMPILAREDENLGQKDGMEENREQPRPACNNSEVAECIGSWPETGTEPCLEAPKRHSLYCEKHIPSWLKRARNGKSRIVSKEVFIELLKDCHSRDRKLMLHRACELFYRLLKSILSLRNPVPKEVQFQWAISEASKDRRIGEVLMKLVFHEKERLERLWGFGESGKPEASSTIEAVVPIPMLPFDDNGREEDDIRCKLCSEKFPEDQSLGNHWLERHKKEAQWLFRGYVCSICLDSFTNKKVLESHVEERHRVDFVEQCMLLQCIPCGSHVGNPEQLWIHVVSTHSSDLRLSSVSHLQDDDFCPKTEPKNSSPMNKNEDSSTRRFICRFCGLKFDLLPDLGRHHQAAHMGQNLAGPRLSKKGIQFYANKMKSGRLSRPRFQKVLHSASYKIRNRIQNLKKSIPQSSFIDSTAPESAPLAQLADSQCSAVAQLLFSEIKNTKPLPSVTDILSVSKTACCKTHLVESLESNYGILPKRMYLKAAKLCSEHDILVEWHREGFVCPKGCSTNAYPPNLAPLVTESNPISRRKYCIQSGPTTSEWTMDESHCVIDSRHFSVDLSEKNIVLCDDISFGQESVPIACVVDENLLNSEGLEGQISDYSFPWENFTYVTKPLLEQSLAPEPESTQLGCGCSHSTCFSAKCDHVYLFDNDYEDAKDIYGKPMNGRFPYDERGRIILEEGYLVYECNQRCSCSKACQNRVLQNGVKLRLEVFKTERKGWAVRAREVILRGTFVCEYIGEVIDVEEANERRIRDGKEGSRYFYEIDAHINDMSRLIEGQAPYVVDATSYGNVSRYINHSCSPNLVNHQVLVESMDNHLAHIGLYANRDISLGEELTYDFRYKLLPGDGCQCLCGSANCRGRLH